LQIARPPAPAEDNDEVINQYRELFSKQAQYRARLEELLVQLQRTRVATSHFTKWYLLSVEEEEWVPLDDLFFKYTFLILLIQLDV
jgi:hypothetical protein